PHVRCVRSARSVRGRTRLAARPTYERDAGHRGVSTNAELLALQRALYESRNPTRRWLHCTRRDWISEQLTRLAAGRRGAALEVGPGSGVYVPLLARLFDRVTVSDVHDAYLDAARTLAAAHANVSVVPDDIRRPALPAASFDVVLCTEVIEHVAESRGPGGHAVGAAPRRRPAALAAPQRPPARALLQARVPARRHRPRPAGLSRADPADGPCQSHDRGRAAPPARRRGLRHPRLPYLGGLRARPRRNGGRARSASGGLARARDPGRTARLAAVDAVLRGRGGAAGLADAPRVPRQPSLRFFPVRRLFRAASNVERAVMSEIERKWYVVDAEGQVLGRLATQVATILRGKHKTSFVPHQDVGDHVVVLNASKVHL